MVPDVDLRDPQSFPLNPFIARSVVASADGWRVEDRVIEHVHRLLGAEVFARMISPPLADRFKLGEVHQIFPNNFMIMTSRSIEVMRCSLVDGRIARNKTESQSVPIRGP
jgi:hypothetical protein